MDLTKNKKLIYVIISLMAILIIGLLYSSFTLISANTNNNEGVSSCCEKTTYGAWCQNDEKSNCDSNYRNSPTFCESTSYCKKGTCINTDEGTCTENSPEKSCEDNGGVWDEGKSEDIPQCQLGCCLMGSQAAYVTQTRCKKLSAVYGLETNFNTGFNSEAECISSAESEVKGACVFEKEFETTCELTTKSKCQKLDIGNKSVNFHEGFLCSADELGTNCGKSERTTCSSENDRIYFLDTCGNTANIYDSSKIDDNNYWSKIYSVEESCGYGDSNSGSASCGSCDYFLGSTCKAKEKGEKVNYGDNICKDLSCEYKGENFDHGETWCVNSQGSFDNLPGSRDFRAVCYNGDVSIEACADFRQETCIGSNINGFKTAACRVNKWQDCTSQAEKKDCENKDKRDCKWTEDKCVPSNAPGFDFWSVTKSGGNDAQDICSQASTTCQVTCKKGLIGGKKSCESDLGCVDKNGNILDGWKIKENNFCKALGDCGSSNNYINTKGFLSIKDMVTETGLEKIEKK